MSFSLSYQARKEQIGQLSGDTYWVLSVLAIIGYPIYASLIVKVLRKLDVQPGARRTFTDSLVERELMWLMEHGYIEGGRTFPCIKNDWREPAARYFYLHSRPQVKKMVRQLLNQTQLGSKYTFYLKDEDSDDLLRLIRLHFFSGDVRKYEEYRINVNRAYAMSDTVKQEIHEEADSYLLPPDAEFIAALPLRFQEDALSFALQYLHEWESDTTTLLCGIIDRKLQEEVLEADFLRVILAHIIVMRGHLNNETRPLAKGLMRTAEGYGLEGFFAMLQQDWDKAEQAFAEIRPKGKAALPPHFLGIAYVLYECRKRQMKKLDPLQQKVMEVNRSLFPNLFRAMRVFLFFSAGEEEEQLSDLMDDLLDDKEAHPLEMLFILLCAYWMGNEPEDEVVDPFVHQLPIWEAAGLHWLCGEMSNVLYLLFPEHVQAQEWRATALVLAEKHGFHYLANLLPRQESWERVLNALEKVSNKGSSSTTGQAKEGEKRVVWFVDTAQKSIQPKEQKMSKRGKWSAGRKIGMSDIVQEKIDSLTAQDLSVREAVSVYGGYSMAPLYYYSDRDLKLDYGHALYQLAGHPHVYLDSREHIPLEIVKGKPELIIEEEEGVFRMEFHPRTKEAGFVVEKETPTRYRVYHVNEKELAIARAVGRRASIPSESRERVEQVIQRLQGNINVQSPMAIADADVETVAGNPLPCLHLLPFGEGFKLEFYVKPLHPEPHYFKPGEGMGTRLLRTEKGQVACERPLPEERRLAKEVIEACPTLQKQSTQDYEWQLDDTEACLQVLMELFPLKEAEKIRLEHPKGERVRLSSIAGMDQLSMQISKQRDWFSVDGEVRLNENEVMDFQRLLEHIRQSDSPFVELADGAFAALTEQFRERLKELDGMLHQRGKKVELPALAGLRMDQLAEEMGELEADMAWAERMQRIQKAQRIRPRVPNSFQAELRNYQKEGFRWMMRLAEWGVGGCLADDMGLGKTIQALAVLSARREEGASLVIAPASVTRNWLRETERFAPSLKPHLLASSKEMAIIEEVGAGDLLLVSYGLLPFVNEALAEKHFANIVLDEAQAIKNSATKRSKAAMALQADFRLATTGTPIENHLGELWNLFRFLNPGLLGSKKHFTEKFAKPISKDNDKERREQLRQLIRPFILRRRKSEVLTELPPKTEVSLTVNLSAEEQAFYEALRRRALDEIEAADENSKRFTLLAQLTRLRQAACHPILAEPSSRLQSSKLELVGETILEILDNGHKALVFSQFVKHLRLVEQWVKQQGIPYQYLDGQTPGKKREAAVEAFQRGEGELFLISLKAGGTGLNLTAADYVLHLDPWWNPAVEDQASDRAHRIGQQRPVTVYRFVSEHTIEEKIVALHAEKRELADQLLAGTDASAKLSVEEMVELIKS